MKDKTKPVFRVLDSVTTTYTKRWAALGHRMQRGRAHGLRDRKRMTLRCRWCGLEIEATEWAPPGQHLTGPALEVVCQRTFTY